MADAPRDGIVAALGRGDPAGAEALCLAWLQAGGGGEATYLLAVARHAAGRLPEALVLFAEAAAALPERADVAANFGSVLAQASRIAEAADQWRRALVLDPNHSHARYNLARALTDLGDLPAAAGAYETLLASHPDLEDGWFNLGNVRCRMRDFTGATSAYGTLLKLDEKSVRGWVNLGMALRGAGDDAGAEQAYRAAVALDPLSVDAHYNLAILLLTQRRWREGLAEFEWRLRLPAAPKPDWPWPRWSIGRPAGTRVLVWNDQGAGDAIQFLRYVPLLAAHGQRVTVLVQDGLKRLAAGMPGVEAAYGFSDSLPEVDTQAPLLSLPHLLGLEDKAVFSWSGPTVAVPPAERDGRRRVGLVWAGNPAHAHDASRSICLDVLAPLLDLPDIAWFSLQVGEAAACRAGLDDLSPGLTDFAATAAAIAGLDLVITVDTAVAHLCGAMGAPAWVLLSAVGTDWRWGRDGETTPWYPSLRLFRQSEPGRWDDVVHRIRHALA